MKTPKTAADITPKLVTDWKNETEEFLENIANGSLITGIHGPLGSGKTLLCYMNVKDFWSAGWNTHANVELKKIPYQKINFRELLVKALMAETWDDDPIVWFMDQIEDYMEARASMEISHQLYSYFIYQVRKRDHRMCYTSTTSYLNDWRLGSETEFSISAQKRHEQNKTLCFVPRCKAKHYFKYFVVNNIRHKLQNKFEVHDPEEMFTEYDSYELYKPYEAMTPSRIQKLLLSIGLSESEVQERLIKIEAEYRHDFNIREPEQPKKPNPPKPKHTPEESKEIQIKNNIEQSNASIDRDKWLAAFSEDPS